MYRCNSLHREFERLNPIISLEIREATRDAVRNMIEVLRIDHGLTREEAYILCSVAGDLRMHEVVSSNP